MLFASSCRPSLRSNTSTAWRPQLRKYFTRGPLPGASHVKVAFRMFFDLNINASDPSLLTPVLEQSVKLGYSAIALNVTVAGRIQSEHACKLSPIAAPGGFVTSSGAPLRQLTRLTVRMDDPVHLHSMASSNPVFRSYDIIAIQPMSDKVWEKCSKDLDVDIITFDLAQRIPVQLKIPKIREAIQRGIYFEINYSAAISDPAQRKAVLGSALNLVRLTGGRNLIFSSAARKAMDIRGPYDVANLGILFGVKQDTALAAVSANCAAAIAHGQARKTVLGVLSVMSRSAVPAADEWKLDTTKRTERPSQQLPLLPQLLGQKEKPKKKGKAAKKGKNASAEKKGTTPTQPKDSAPPVIRGISASLSRGTAPAPEAAPSMPAAASQHKRKPSKGNGQGDQQPQKRAASSEKDTDSDMGSAVNTLRLREGHQ